MMGEGMGFGSIIFYLSKDINQTNLYYGSAIHRFSDPKIFIEQGTRTSLLVTIGAVSGSQYGIHGVVFGCGKGIFRS